jgi:hypothetical protein
MEIINVLELKNGELASLTSFSDKDKNGNKKAEELFINKIENYLEEQLNEEDKKFYIEKGYYEDKFGYDISIEKQFDEEDKDISIEEQLNEEDEEFYLEEGYYGYQYEYKIYIIHSDINE